MSKKRKNNNRKNSGNNSREAVRSKERFYNTWWFNEIAGLISIFLAVFIFVSLYTYSPYDPSFNNINAQLKPQNKFGIPGSYFADIAFQLFGESAYLLSVFLAVIAVKLIQGGSKRTRYVMIFPLSILVFSFCLLSNLVFKQSFLGKQIEPGGVVGSLARESLVPVFNLFGTYLLGVLLLLISTILVLGIRISSVSIAFAKAISWMWRQLTHLAPKIETIPPSKDYIAGKSDTKASRKKDVKSKLEEKRRKREQAKAEKEAIKRLKNENILDEQQYNEPSQPPEIVTNHNNGNYEESDAKFTPREDQPKLISHKKYVLPPLSILQDPPAQSEQIETEELYRTAEALINKLKHFGVEGKVIRIRPGPVVTRYEFEPSPGIKVSKVVGLSDDLALALGATAPPRIALIPGKSALGIELPNKKRDIIYIKEILASDSFIKEDAALKIALGKNIQGDPYIANLSDMPHLLIAGATGAGKSVCINSILVSLLMTYTPQELQLVLIDPKRLELSIYDDIPHLRDPVVIDPKVAASALGWAVEKMEERYDTLADDGVRNIVQYNETMRQRAKQEQWSDAELEMNLMPYLVIIIDEFSDLMTVASREVETYIIRLAQMARAAGIHLVVATQRPSVNVVTGIIKVNFPCRIAFKVTQRVDSRTIIDQIGAEKLLGRGDMLFIPPGSSKPIRVHGAYVSEREINSIIDFIKDQNYIAASTNHQDEEEEPSLIEVHNHLEQNQDLVSQDPLYQRAMELVVSTGHASISMLQRRFKVGYARAARLIDMMERAGVVGPFEGSKPREVLLTPDQIQYSDPSPEQDDLQ